jgi:hypothetical protein
MKFLREIYCLLAGDSCLYKFKFQWFQPDQALRFHKKKILEWQSEISNWKFIRKHKGYDNRIGKFIRKAKGTSNRACTCSNQESERWRSTCNLVSKCVVVSMYACVMHFTAIVRVRVVLHSQLYLFCVFNIVSLYVCVFWHGS